METDYWHPSSPVYTKNGAEQPSAERSKLGDQNYREILENWKALRDNIVAGLTKEAAEKLAKMQVQEDRPLQKEEKEVYKPLSSRKSTENNPLQELNNIRTSLELLKLREKGEIQNESSGSLLKNNSEINKRRILEYQKVNA